ncbi:MAG: ferredoxin reductase [Solirubrobacteraceae bacterium]|nr:ferredoxin reductase [Solirubrobacteraceae bacterium]
MVDPNTWRVARVQRVVRETPRAVTLRLDVADWPVGQHRAGQRIDVRLTAEDGYQATRAYSIASPPQWPQVDVTVEEIMDGEVSPYLVEDVQVGDELEVRGPIGGAFTWRPADGGPLLLVAGGSGVVPLMAMLRAHAEERSGTDVRLLLSARTVADALYLDELDRLSDEGLVQRHVTLTRQPAPPGWPGSTQRVDAAMLAELGPSPAASPLIFVCGPTGFVESVSDALLANGHHPGAIRTERFGPTS